MTLQNKGTYKDKLTLYIPPEKKQLVQKASQILERENSSLSKFFVEKIEDYCKLHGEGNPQQTLTHIFKNGKPYRAPSQCACGRIAEFEFLAENIRIKVCGVCLSSLKMRYDQYAVKPLKKRGE